MAIDVKRVLARNTVWNYAGFAINMATNLVMLPYVVHSIGSAAAGVWLLLSSVTGYMGLLELGIVPSLTQSIAASLGGGRREAVSRAASTALALLCALAGVALLVALAAPGLVAFLSVPAELESAAALALVIAITGFALRMPLAAFQGILLGCQRQDRCSQLWIGMGVAKFAGAIVVLSSGFGLAGLVATEALIHLLAGIFQVRWVYQELPHLRLSWRLVDRGHARGLVSFGGAMFAVTICSLLIEQTDRMVIALFLPIAMVTSYAAAWKLYMLAFAVTTTFVQAVAPVAADLHGRGETAALRELFLRSTKYTAALAWPLVLTIGLSGGFLLRIWMGPEFVAALPVLQVLFVAFLVTAHNHAGYSALIGMRRVGRTVPTYFVPQAVLNVVLSIWLVGIYGNVGVALGTAIPALALEYVYLRFLLGELGVSWRQFVTRAVRPPAIAALGAYSPLAATYALSDPAAPILLAVAGVCTILYAVVFSRFLDAGERAVLLGYLPAWLSPPRGWRAQPVSAGRERGA
jgi:O-antigen/teichoic acid export membrane protein